MSRTHSYHRPIARTPRHGGFTYVEMVICLALMVVIVGAFATVLDSGSDSLFTACARGLLSARTEQAQRRLATDLRESPAAHVASCQGCLPEGQRALLLSSARDADGTFHVTSDCRPDWQAAVVYCPYVTQGGVSQLRRYVYYDSAYNFPLKFRASEPISADYIYIQDNYGTDIITVNRKTGNALLPSGRNFEVLCPGLTAIGVEVGSPTSVSLCGSCMTRRGVAVNAERTFYVAHRN